MVRPGACPVPACCYSNVVRKRDSHLLPASLLAIGLVLSLVPPLLADDSSRAEPLESELVEQSEVHLVQLNLLAVDGEGNPVLDLKPEDLSLMVDREPHQIAFLERYGVGPEPLAAESADAAGDPVSDAEGGGARRESASAPRYIAFLIDLFAASPRARSEGLKAMRSYIDEMYREGDRVSLFTFDGRLNLVLKMSEDIEEIRAAAEQLAEAGSTKSWANPIQDLNDLMVQLPGCQRTTSSFEMVVSCASSLARNYENSRAFASQRYLEAMIALTGALSVAPGTKVLVVFSEGFSRFPSVDARMAVETTLGDQVAERIYFTTSPASEFGFKRLIDAAADARVSLFTVNPQFGQSLSGIKVDRVPDFQLAQLQGDRQAVDMVRFVQRGAQQSLDELARETGGASLRTPSGVKGVARILERAEGLYTLGFYAPRGKRGIAERIRIEALREGVEVQKRRTIPRVRDREPLVGRLEVLPGACDEEGMRLVPLRVELDRDSFEFDKIGRYYRTNFAYYLRVLPPASVEPAYEQYRLFSLKHTRRELREGTLEDPVIEQQLRLPCADMVVRVTVTDLADGSRGEFDAALQESP